MLPNRYRWHRNDAKIEGYTTDSSIIEKILYGRAIKEHSDIERFLHPKKEQMHSPYLLNDMACAVDRIQQAKEKGEHIVVYGDYDVDGVTSTSILYMFLKEQGYSVSYYIPSRTEEGYGLNTGAIYKIKQYAQLMITVDTGIAANQEIDYANEIGIDIIITDHHECQEILPSAYCVINPKRRDTTYPFDCLAGVGVTFKLIHALAIREEAEDKIWKYIDIVALGTVADVVPLEKENRIITHLGFKQMAMTEHVGLRALIEVLPTKPDKITSNIIGYQLGPRINAAGRISDAKIGVELLTTPSYEHAKDIATKLDEENKKRQDMEQEILLQTEEYIQKYVNIEEEKIIIVAGNEWHHGVIGIVASRVLSKYYKPTIILTKEDGIYSGSARSVEGFNIFEAINSAKEHLIRFGGHEMAAGLSLKEEDLEAFRESINNYAKDLLTQELLTPKLTVDLEVDADEMTLDLYDQLEYLEPFGVSNPMPTFAVRGIIQYAQKIGQDKHLKISIQKGNAVLHGVGFDKGNLVDELTEGEEVIIACELTKNVWNGKTSVQIRIKDIISPETKVLESQYYLQLYEYLTEPESINQSKLDLVKVEKPNKEEQICIYTEKSAKKVMPRIQHLWYNNPCISKEKVAYEWDFKSTGKYNCMNTSLDRHRTQLEKMIPSHTNCKDMYRFLRNNNQSISLHKLVQQFVTINMTEYKALQILDIFKELNLLDYRFDGIHIHYKLLDTNKTKLEHSKRYMTLQGYAQSILDY